MFIFAKKGKKIVWYLFCEECVCLRLFSRLSRYLRGLLDKELKFHSYKDYLLYERVYRYKNS